MGTPTTTVSDFYLQILEDFPALIWRAGLDKKCNYFNKTWLAFTGRSLEEERGDGWAEGVHPEDLDRCFRTYVENFEARTPFAMEYRLRNRFGEYRWIKDLGRPFFTLDGEFLGYIGSCYDVTEERANALKLKELNAVKDRFFGLIAHDLRGPLGAIEGLAELLADPNCPDEGSSRVALARELEESARKTSKFLEDLLAWSRTQFEGLAARPEPLSLVEVVEQATQPLRPSLLRKGLSVEVERPAPRFVGDPDMTKTVVRNLISNAIKYSPRGGRIVVRARGRQEAVVVSVADEGIGLPPDQIDQLFHLGSRTSRPGTEGELGSGFGLVLCREFVERQGGALWAENRQPQGAVFSFRLPAAP